MDLKTFLRCSYQYTLKLLINNFKTIAQWERSGVYDKLLKPTFILTIIGNQTREIKISIHPMSGNDSVKQNTNNDALLFKYL